MTERDDLILDLLNLPKPSSFDDGDEGDGEYDNYIDGDMEYDLQLRTIINPPYLGSNWGNRQ